MEITSANLRTLTTGFRATFQGEVEAQQAASQYTMVAEVVPSTTASEEYGWLGDVPNVREWVGDRVVHGLATHGYTIKNKEWESTIAVRRPTIEDDQYGIFAPRLRMMARAAVAHRDQLVWSLFKAGFSTVCFDGQYFFDTDHGVLDEDGQPISVANTDGGSGTGWYLLASGAFGKPIIFQERRRLEFTTKDNPDHDNVFNKNQFEYGSYARYNVGFGFWQSTWGSRQTLDATSYEAARIALQQMKGDYGRPLGLMPDTLIVPPSLEGAAREVVGVARLASGADNKWYQTATVQVVPWLA